MKRLLMRNQNNTYHNKPFVKKERVKMGLTVEVRYPPNPSPEQIANSFSNAYRKFKKLIMTENVLQEHRDREFYMKPSDKRNKAKAMAKKRWAKKRKEIRQERGW